ncbi:hypothetical protein MPSEU_000215200 [Mayamaea pseudoterrestris]|nr:hypothetical protein MPSEU_000215200 [Mayamaea pseudoterrestris]
MASLMSLAPSLRSYAQRSVRLNVGRSMTIISKDSGEDFKKQNYSERMKDKGMPVSPHVTVYAFPMAALTSIVNRVTGCLLSVGCFGIGAAELLGSGNGLALMEWTASHGMLMTAAAKFAVTFTASYHYGAGVRHFIWDYYPENLTNTIAEKSSWQLIGASAGLGTITMFF